MNSSEQLSDITVGEKLRALSRMVGGISVGFAHELDKGNGFSFVESIALKVGGIESNSFEDSSFGVKAYEEILGRTLFWHGTGRYYATWDDEHVDVLQGILQDGGLRAAVDSTDHRIGPVNIVATSPNRMLARVYADSHAFDLKAQSRYGESSFWLGFFAGRIAHEMLSEGTLKSFVAHTLGVAIKTKRLRQPHIQKESVMNAKGLLRGSGISNNFPIIIGIGSAGLAQTIKHKQEVRFSEVPLDSFTHVQAPRDNIEEVESLFDKHGIEIPAICIEDVEAYTANKTFSFLLN